MDTFVALRDPYPPHGERVRPMVNDLSYGFMLLRANTASFTVRKTDVNLPDYTHHFDVGAMVTIERTDDALPWVGFITKRVADVDAPVVRFIAKDHIGALFAVAPAAKQSTIRTASAGSHIADAVMGADARAFPPLLVSLDLDQGGHAFDYNQEAQFLDELLGTMAQMTGWEWGLRLVAGKTPSITLTWQERQGHDQRGQVAWEQGRHFKKAKYTQEATGFAGASLAIGGTGPVGARPAVGAAKGGAWGPGVFPVPTHELPDMPGPAGGRNAPALLGTRVLFERQITNEGALGAAALRLLDPPDAVGEHLSFTLVESEIDMNYPPHAGQIVTVRFSDLDLGLGLVRVVRILGLQVDPAEGTIDVEAKVLGEEAPGGIT